MKTNKTNLKALVLSLGLAALMAPASAMAQNTTERPGGLFGLNDQSRASLLNQKTVEGEGLFLNVGTQPFQDPAPLGSGIAILIGAGLGYVALKKKEDEQ
ncbi:MAG: hypothetical protein J6W30_00935 [Bacteroidales bacterium]|nr:hypothetical protein [Bacteroidales bacterium]